MSQCESRHFSTRYCVRQMTRPIYPFLTLTHPLTHPLTPPLTHPLTVSRAISKLAGRSQNEI